MPDKTEATKTEFTQAELTAEAHARFGDDQNDFAFICPCCKDVATIGDFTALQRTGAAGKDCIGRYVGALQGKATRGCDWTVLYPFGGPWTIVMANGDRVHSFELAPATVPS